MTPTDFSMISKMQAVLLAKCPYLRKYIGDLWQRFERKEITCDELGYMLQHLLDKKLGGLDVRTGYDGERHPNRPAGIATGRCCICNLVRAGRKIGASWYCYGCVVREP